MVVVRPVPLPVRCLNCGSGDTLATRSLIVAVVALVVAAVALYITLREHREFMKQLGARARFDLAVLLEQGFERGEVSVESGHPEITFRVTLDNVGEKAAGETILNVFAPATNELVWSTRSGMQLSSPDDAAATPEKLRLPDGTEVEARMIAKAIPRVARRAGHMTWFTVVVRQPADLHVRVVAQCDDLPDDQENVTADRLLRVR